MKSYNPLGAQLVERGEPQRLIGISIVHDNTLFRSRLAEALRQQPDFVVQVFPDLTKMPSETQRQQQRICLICSPAQLDELAGDYASLLASFERRCLILDNEPCPETLAKFLAGGFRGYYAEVLLPARLASAIRAVESGAFWMSGEVENCLVKIAANYLKQAKCNSNHGLTEREKSVLALMAKGLTNRQIAEEQFLSLATIKATVRNVFCKLDIHDRTQAAIYAWENGIIQRSC